MFPHAYVNIPGRWQFRKPNLREHNFNPKLNQALIPFCYWKNWRSEELNLFLTFKCNLHLLGFIFELCVQTLEEKQEQSRRVQRYRIINIENISVSWDICTPCGHYDDVPSSCPLFHSITAGKTDVPWQCSGSESWLMYFATPQPRKLPRRWRTLPPLAGRVVGTVPSLKLPPKKTWRLSGKEWWGHGAQHPWSTRG